MSKKSFDAKLEKREAKIRVALTAASNGEKTNMAHVSDTIVRQEMEQELAILKAASSIKIMPRVREMTADDYPGLLDRIKAAFARQGIPSESIWLELSNSNWWAVSLFLPYRGLTLKKVNSIVKRVLVNDVGVDKNRIDCYGKDEERQACEWYFMPPGVSKEIQDAIDKAIYYQLQQEGDDDFGLGIPIPNKTKDTGEIPLLVLPEELYRKIESGEKRIDYRNLVTYYCDMFFGTGKMVKAVRFQFGILGESGGEPEQMTWEVKDIMLVSEHGKMAPAMTDGEMSTFKNLPRVFPPVAYAIILGSRLPNSVSMCDIPDRAFIDTPTKPTAVDADIRRLVDGIKAGRLKSKTPDGYLVLKGQFYDAIDSGKKTVEYRDFTEYNIKRTIGLKTIRFNRGYVKNAPQMKWEVKKIVLMDGEDQECDPFNVPNGFCPAAIAIHLGKRIA